MNSYYVDNGEVSYPISETMVSGNMADATDEHRRDLVRAGTSARASSRGCAVSGNRDFLTDPLELARGSSKTQSALPSVRSIAARAPTPLDTQIPEPPPTRLRTHRRSSRALARAGCRRGRLRSGTRPSDTRNLRIDFLTRASASLRSMASHLHVAIDLLSRSASAPEYCCEIRCERWEVTPLASPR
jgi:hypothetical protein